jgi:hypothetical protein
MNAFHAAASATSPSDRVGHGLLLVGTAATCVVLYSVDPAAEDNPYPLCPFRALTGMPCPGCGALRATNRLLHADLGAAVGYNALLVLMLPMLAYVLASSLGTVIGRELPRPTLPRWSGYAVLLVVLAFWVLRNVPVEPLSALAP